MKQTPKQKATELFNYYYILIQDIGGELGQEILVSILAKQCALFAVDEILRIRSVNKDDILSNYWEEVEQEIENL
jgi:hypothetical protein